MLLITLNTNLNDGKLQWGNYWNLFVPRGFDTS
jgi:hypothetical protein